MKIKQLVGVGSKKIMLKFKGPCRNKLSFFQHVFTTYFQNFKETYKKIGTVVLVCWWIKEIYVYDMIFYIYEMKALKVGSTAMCYI